MSEIKINKTNPFEWGVVEECRYISQATQRNAKYNTPAQETFTGTVWGSFMYNEQAPSPQIKNVCGIDCPDSDGCGEDDGD